MGPWYSENPGRWLAAVAIRQLRPLLAAVRQVREMARGRVVAPGSAAAAADLFE